MAYIDREKLKEQINDTCKYAQATNDYQRGCNAVCDWAVKIIKNMPTEDVVPRSEVNDLEYKLIGVMHSVDKWLEGDELNQDEVNRAITMREKTLKIVEALEDERDRYKKYYFRHEYDKWEAEIKQEVAREIFEEIDKLIVKPNGMWLWQWDLNKLAELKKKYIGG